MSIARLRRIGNGSNGRYLIHTHEIWIVECDLQQHECHVVGEISSALCGSIGDSNGRAIINNRQAGANSYKETLTGLVVPIYNCRSRAVTKITGDTY